MPLKVLTFNLHSQYLHLLSYTGWDIDNLVIPPTRPPGWHTQPYGYPTFSPAVHPVPGFDYYGYFPADWTTPPDPAMVPPVENIHDVIVPEDDYDLVIYIERDSLAFYHGPARKRVMVNFVADGFAFAPDVDEIISHVQNIPGTVFIPMGIPDNYLPRKPEIEEVLVSYAAGRWRPHLLNQDMMKRVSEAVPLHLHDMVEELWDYKQLTQALSQFWLYLSPMMLTGGPPLATVEAFMAGMPVILHDPYNHFSSFENNKHCLRVNSGYEALLAVRSLWTNESREELGARGREHAAQYFNISRFVEGWWEVAR